MRTLTHRSIVHPAQNTRQEMRKEQPPQRRLIEGQKVHLSGRSMWRGYWYGKGAIAKWNRVDQVLTGRLSYYRGRQVEFSQISLLETHHAAARIAPKGICADMEGEGKRSHGTGEWKNEPAACQVHHCTIIEAEHAPAVRGESTHHDSKPIGIDAQPGRAGTVSCVAPQSDGEPAGQSFVQVRYERIAKAAGPDAAGQSTAPLISGDYHANTDEDRRLPERKGVQGADETVTPAQEQGISRRVCGHGNGTIPRNAVVFMPEQIANAISDALSPAMSQAAALGAGIMAACRGAHDERGVQGRRRGGAPSRMGDGISHADIPLAPPVHDANQNPVEAGKDGRRHTPHVYAQKRKGIQLKVARADAIPPQ